MLAIKILIIDRYNGVKRVYMRWIQFIHLYINNIFIHLNLLKRYFVGVLDSLRVLWYHHAKFSKNYLGFFSRHVSLDAQML